MKKKQPIKRKQKTTILIVGEGYAEKNLLLHLKRIYPPTNTQMHITIGNAGGKTAEYVINYAIRVSKQI